MKVLILSKTHIGNDHACVGGVTVDSLQYIRLMTGIRQYQSADTAFEIGEIWNVKFKETPDVPPHIEDVIIAGDAEHVDDISVSKFIKEKGIRIWNGSVNKLFDGCLNFLENNKAYISKDNIPSHSIGFWISNKDLRLQKAVWDGKVRYRYINDEVDMSYVGFTEPIKTIPKGTLLRVSLAKWFTPTNRPHGCYLQLSGWYDD